VGNLSNEIIAENFPSLGKYIDIHVQEAFWTPSGHDRELTLRRLNICHVIMTMPRVENKERLLKAAKENASLHTKVNT
jgi:hypothetical protein